MCSSDLCEQWPGGRNALAAQLNVKRERVAKWSQRDFIPAEFWGLLIAAAHGVGFDDVTAELLTALAGKKTSAVTLSAYESC